jgi:hypothetical protein
MSQHHFHVKTDDWPLVSSDDELMIVHRNSLAINAVLYIGAHRECTVEIRSALNREDVETATVPAVGGSALPIPAGGVVKFDLPGSGGGIGPLHLVSKITTTGQVFVHISSAGEFDAYFKQVNVPSI